MHTWYSNLLLVLNPQDVQIQPIVLLGYLLVCRPYIWNKRHRVITRQRQFKGLSVLSFCMKKIDATVTDLVLLYVKQCIYWRELTSTSPFLPSC